jgi:uncharacterized phiE125 gp8 family phage protein
MDDILLRTIAPTAEPVTLDQARTQARIETDDENGAIASLITTARSYVEETTGRALVTQTWTWQHPSWQALFGGSWAREGRVTVPRPPLQSAVITYLDPAGVSQTLPVTEYVVTPGDPGTIEPSSTFSWPALSDSGYPITVTFVAGYGDVTHVPLLLNQVMLLLIKDWYDERGSVITGTRAQVAALPRAVDALLNLFRWHL